MESFRRIIDFWIHAINPEKYHYYMFCRHGNGLWCGTEIGGSG